MEAILWEDVVRLIALGFTLCCTIINIISTFKRTNTTHIKSLINWYVKEFQRGHISANQLANSMEHLKELAKISKDSNPDEPTK